MNQNFTQLEKDLERAANGVTLSVHEKDTGRTALRAYMKQTGRSLRSPYQNFMILTVRSMTLLLIIVVSGGSIASASESSLPGSMLYSVKTQVTEPLRAVLLSGSEARADFAVERASRRLEEYAQVSKENRLDEVTSNALAEALQTHVATANKEIQALAQEGNETGAFDATSDLYSILEAHAEVLDRLDDAHPGTVPEDGELAQTLADALESTESLSTSFETSITSSLDTPKIEAALKNQQEEVGVLVRALEAYATSTPVSFDSADALTLAKALTEVRSLMEEATRAQDENRLTDALSLYADANAKVNQLDIILKADSQLGVDIINATSSSDTE